MGANFGVSNITISKERSYFEFNDFKAFLSGKLPELVEKSNQKAFITMTDKARIEFNREVGTNAETLKVMRTFLEQALKL